MAVAPGCLRPGRISSEYFEGAGYGQDENGLQTNKLLKVQLKNMDVDRCQESYQLAISGEYQMCAESYREDIETQDLCYGDSGSALQYMNKDHREGDVVYNVPVLVGVTSFGIGCGFGFPSVYVNVSAYIDWMESVISP
jgi:secreted trypsin-like serine protease